MSPVVQPPRPLRNEQGEVIAECCRGHGDSRWVRLMPMSGVFELEALRELAAWVAKAEAWVLKGKRE